MHASPAPTPGACHAPGCAAGCCCRCFAAGALRCRRCRSLRSRGGHLVWISTVRTAPLGRLRPPALLRRPLVVALRRGLQPRHQSDARTPALLVQCRRGHRSSLRRPTRCAAESSMKACCETICCASAPYGIFVSGPQLLTCRLDIHAGQAEPRRTRGRAAQACDYSRAH